MVRRRTRTKVKTISFNPSKSYVSPYKYKFGGRGFKSKQEAINWLKARRKLGFCIGGGIEKIKR